MAIDDKNQAMADLLAVRGDDRYTVDASGNVTVLNSNVPWISNVSGTNDWTVNIASGYELTNNTYAIQSIASDNGASSNFVMFQSSGKTTNSFILSITDLVLLSFVIATGVSTILNFIGQKWWVFK